MNVTAKPWPIAKSQFRISTEVSSGGDGIQEMHLACSFPGAGKAWQEGEQKVPIALQGPHVQRLLRIPSSGDPYRKLHTT